MTPEPAPAPVAPPYRPAAMKPPKPRPVIDLTNKIDSVARLRLGPEDKVLVYPTEPIDDDAAIELGLLVADALGLRSERVVVAVGFGVAVMGPGDTATVVE